MGIMTQPSSHRTQQHRCAIAGVEAMTLISDRAFPRHSHDAFGVGVIAFGAQSSWSGVGQVDAAVGDAIMVNPGEVHDGSPIAGQVRGWRMLYFDPALLRRELAEEDAEGLDVVRPVADDPILADRFAALFASLTSQAADGFAIEEGLVRSLQYIQRRHGAAEPPGPGKSSSVRRALQRLDMAPDQPTTVRELANLSGVSRFQLIRSFAREVGMTPHAYLVQTRVRLARRLLAAGRSLAQAAAEAGFSDQSHMTRAFVRQIGVTPGTYRNAVA